MLTGSGRFVMAALVMSAWAGARAHRSAIGRRRVDRRGGPRRPTPAGALEQWRNVRAAWSDDLAAALPEAVDAVAAAVRAGRSVHDGLALAAGAAPPRLAGELRAVAAMTDRGMTIAAALDRWSESSAVPGASLVAAAVGLAGETGGDVAGALGGVADTLRERRALAREIRALSSQARMSAAVVALAPLAFAALATAADGDTAGFLFGSAGGVACLVVGIGLDLLGWRWMRRIAGSVGHG